MTKPSDTIESREPRYGDYYERSDLKERIIEAFSEGRNWMGLKPDARNSLFMIADKLSRILNGDPDDPDSWHDIGGYAGLVEGRLTTADSVEKLRDFPYPGSVTFTVTGFPAGEKEPTRCPYFTGEPPSWDDIEGDWLVQDCDGQFKSYRNHPQPCDAFPWWHGKGLANLSGRDLGRGPQNPNWKLAIEPRPETHK